MAYNSEQAHKQYIEFRKRKGLPINIYRERKGYILSNAKESKYFRTIQEVADFLGVTKSTAYYRAIKAKGNEPLKGWYIEEGI